MPKTRLTAYTPASRPASAILDNEIIINETGEEINRRKLAVALYFMMLTGKEFSYEKYSLIKNISVFNISVDELPELIPDFKRYIKILHENNINNTSELVTAFLSCSLGSCKGLGKKFFSTLREFMNNQHKYKQIYENMRCNL